MLEELAKGYRATGERYKVWINCGTPEAIGELFENNPEEYKKEDDFYRDCMESSLFEVGSLIYFVAHLIKSYKVAKAFFGPYPLKGMWKVIRDKEVG